MEEKEIFILHDERLDYHSKIKDEKISLNYSKDEEWSSHVRGTEIGTLEDDGNKINIDFKNIKLHLDYDDFVELFILFNLKVKNSDNLCGEIKYLKND